MALRVAHLVPCSSIDGKKSDFNWEFRMVLMIAYLSWPLALSFIECKCLIVIGGFRMVLIVVHLSWSLAILFIGSKWSYFDEVIQDCADVCLSVLAPFSLIVFSKWSVIGEFKMVLMFVYLSWPLLFIVGKW